MMSEQAFKRYDAALRATLPALHKAEREYFDAQHTEQEAEKLAALRTAEAEASAAAKRAGQVLRAEFPDLFAEVRA